ncbi:MAG: Gfo/Idh/MocA family oxidoreductase [Candidatus Poseidoniaceae archaeon]|jgi:predicted dehydrogenase|nr:Gfo/Idh/MocA family oxidoreductase [Candidatus Poseidoniaceae archaeon]
MLDVVLLGCGRWGSNHLRTLCQLRDQEIIDTVTVVDPQPLTITGADKHFNSMDGVNADLVIVATPSHMHSHQAKELLSAGYHVLVEKPLGCSEKEAAQVLACANENGRVIGVGLLLRFHPAISLAKQLIANGTLGRLESMRFARRTTRPPPPEGNVVESLGVHAIDLVCHLMGEVEPSAIHAEGDLIDSRIAIEFPHAIEAIIDVAWSATIERRNMIINGSNGTLRIDLDIYDKAIFTQGGKEIEMQCKTAISPLESELRHIISAVEAQIDGRGWQTTPDHGAALRGVRWTEKAVLAMPIVRPN